MPTPLELFKEELEKAEKRGLSRTDVGKRAGRDYRYIHRICTGYKAFDEKTQRQMAVALGLDADYFSRFDEARQRRRSADRAYREFLRSEFARELDDDTRRTLKDMPIHGKVPTKATYQAIALALTTTTKRVTSGQILRAVDLNDDLDAEIDND